MKLTYTLAAVAAILTAPAVAQDYSASNHSQSQSHSQSGSSIERGGDRVNATTAIAPSMGTTAPCVIGQSLGVGIAGIGISGGGGKLEKGCITRTEAAMLSDIGRMHPNDPSRRVAIMHLCTNAPAVSRTLVAMGWCVYATN